MAAVLAREPGRRRVLASVLALMLVVAGVGTGPWVRWVQLHPVAAVRPGPARLHPGVRGAGELIASRQVELGSPVTLRVRAIRADIGDHVREGQLLLLLDADELDAQWQAAREAHRSARQTLAAAQQVWRRAALTRQQAEADARRADDLMRQDPDAIAAREVEALGSAARVAQLDTDIAHAQMLGARHLLGQAEAQADAARQKLRQTALRAPFDALVTGRHCSAGDLASPTRPCLTLVDVGSLKARVRFDESVLSSLRPGDVAQLQLRSGPEHPITARLEIVHRAVDTDTREFTADFRPETLPERWALGERVTALVHVREHPVDKALPARFVSSAGTRRGAWIERDGRAHWTELRLGMSDERQLVEIQQGLDGAPLVLDPAGLAPGMRVRPLEQAW